MVVEDLKTSWSMLIEGDGKKFSGNALDTL